MLGVGRRIRMMFVRTSIKTTGEEPMDSTPFRGIPTVVYQHPGTRQPCGQQQRPRLSTLPETIIQVDGMDLGKS